MVNLYFLNFFHIFSVFSHLLNFLVVGWAEAIRNVVFDTFLELSEILEEMVVPFNFGFSEERNPVAFMFFVEVAVDYMLSKRDKMYPAALILGVIGCFANLAFIDLIFI